MADTSFLRWPFFDDRHRVLARRLDEWCRANLQAPPHDKTDLDTACRNILARLASGGWLRYVVPRSHGGISDTLDVRSLCILRETLARYDGLADFVFAMQGLGSCTITLFGSDAQRNAYLPNVASGASVAAFAMTEARSGSDVAGMEMTARRDGDGFVLSGEKTLISNGGIANHYVVFARTGEAPGARGISAFVVDAADVEIVERIEAIAPHPLGRLRFADRRVAAHALLGNAGDGFKYAMATLDVFRSTVGAAALGFARRALDEATARAQERRLFGRSLAENEVTQSKLAEMVGDIDASALLVYRAAWARDLEKIPATREAALAKLYATEMAQTVIDKAVQIFGGLGVVRGVPVEALYREIRALRIYEGASELQKMVIARQHLRAATASS